LLPIKKTDAFEHPEVFERVGLLVNKPPGQSRVAVQLVIRPTSAWYFLGAGL